MAKKPKVKIKRPRVKPSESKEEVKKRAKKKKFGAVSRDIVEGDVSLMDHQSSSGNQWFLWRSTHGRDKIFKDPQAMLDAGIEYFEKTLTRPYKKEEWKSTKNGLKKVSIDVVPPYTWEGLCIFLHVNTNYFRTFRHQLKMTDPHYHGFNMVIEFFDNTIRLQKFEGATVGKYKENIIALDLGLKKPDNVISTSGSGLNIFTDGGTKGSELLQDVKAQLEKIDNE